MALNNGLIRFSAQDEHKLQCEQFKGRFYGILKEIDTHLYLVFTKKIFGLPYSFDIQQEDCMMVAYFTAALFD